MEGSDYDENSAASRSRSRETKTLFKSAISQQVQKHNEKKMRCQMLQETMYKKKIETEKKDVMKNINKMKKLQQLETALLDNAQR